MYVTFHYRRYCRSHLLTDHVTNALWLELVLLIPSSILLSTDHVFLSSARMVVIDIISHVVTVIGHCKNFSYSFIYSSTEGLAWQSVRVCVCVWDGCGGSSLWHYSVYVSEIVCVGNCSINQSSAVIVRLIVRYVPVGLEALVCVIHVRMWVQEREEESACVMCTSIHSHQSIIAVETNALAIAVWLWLSLEATPEDTTNHTCIGRPI